MGAAAKERIKVEVAKDRLTAFLQRVPNTDLSDLTADEVCAALARAKVADNEAVIARVNDFVVLAKQGSAPDEFLIAEGQAPVEGEHGRLQWAEAFNHHEDDPAGPDSIDHRARNSIHTVEKDEELGTVVPPRPGTPGADVHGNVLQPKLRPEPIVLGDSVGLSEEDGETATALRAGRVVLKAHRLNIHEVLEIRGDVDFNCGNVDATTDVSIRGTIHDLFVVRGKKSITVGGAIEAARVQASEDILVRGGVLSRGKGLVRAGHAVSAKFCDEADIQSANGIHIAREAINSRLFTYGRLECPRAAVIGGEVYARQGVEVHTLGSEACVATRVAVGIHPSVIRKVRSIDEELEKKQVSVEKIREVVQPLMANIKRLTGAQKEKATELLYQADEIESEINAAREQQAGMLSDGTPETPASVLVHGQICQNVVILIGEREAHFHNELKGPVRIEQRKIKNVTEFVAVNQLTGSVIRINSGPCDFSRVTDPPSDNVDQSEATPADSASPQSQPAASAPQA